MMVSREISLDSAAVERPHFRSRLSRPVLTAIILGLLTAASIVLLIYHENRARDLGIEAAESWSAYQMKLVQTTIEEDPNLKEQYTEEQDLLRRHAQGLKQTSRTASNAVMLSTFAALVLLFGAAAAVIALFAKSTYTGYGAVLLGVIGVVLCIKALF